MSAPSPPSTGRYDQATGSGESAPLGIKIICVLTVLFDVFFLFVALVGLGAGGQAAIVGGLMLVILILDLVGVYGLWTLQSWGWIIVVVMRSISLVLDLVGGDIVGLLVGGLILAYIYSKRDLYTS